ncbi:ABC transporter permease [Clostridium formicaceticum]|uniref:Branched-chain amino acid ABC transporter permease n=1 Tax=Clostridium formicaceticum TaxID=1497 RepID=A0AAC9RLF2_9CLOT|nr:ABC transporter permease [Clostridium formicaceticum]AOY74964.1 branched-chain amino acid ABC transporter permease [Clostridium formicaceticum]ARE89376.1 Branched-chain amino acid transport system / permease component [Clostridium formicaceticum]
MSNTADKLPRREPLIRIAKREELQGKQVALLYILAFIAAIITGGLFLFLLGLNPIKAYITIIDGAFRSKIAIQGTVRIAIPLLISSLGITLAFKMKFWNIGAEGQIIMGGIFATYFALFHSDWPHGILIAVMLVAGMVGGGLWALIPAFFKTKFGTNETLFTLMLNYIALYMIKYLTEGPWLDPNAGGFPKIASFHANARLDRVFGVHAGWVIGLIFVVFIFIYLKFSKHGYEISVVGESQNTAKYAGINVKKVIMRTMFLSGGICGIAGMAQATGAAYTLSEGIAGGVGFTAIIVAWLSYLNPILILVVTILFSILEKGCSVMQSAFGLSAAVSAILQGIILFFILGFDFFRKYQFIFRKRLKGGQTS